MDNNPSENRDKKPLKIKKSEAAKPVFHLSPETRQAEKEAALRRFATRKVPKWRWMLWIAEVVMLLAVIEQFLVKPFLKKRTAKDTFKIELHGERIPEMNEMAKLPKGLIEAKPAFFPKIELLAEGSERMIQAQKTVSNDEKLPVEVVNSIGMRFRLIPAGTGMIGSPENEKGRGDIEVRHVQIFPEHFYMGKYEVTQEQWIRVMGTTEASAGYKGENRPMEEVTWYDCQRFVSRLNQLEDLPENTYRLPTEAEWEYACRAGTDTAFCFGDDYEKLKDWADFEDNNYRGTSEVGTKLPNALGLHDMHGNVREWCRDLYANYPGDDSDLGERSVFRNIRGGNWYVGATECRSANRCCLPPGSKGNMLGFRIIRSVKP